MFGLSHPLLGKCFYPSVRSVNLYNVPAIVPENARTFIPVLKLLHCPLWFPTDINLLTDVTRLRLYRMSLVLLQNKGLGGPKLKRFQDLQFFSAGRSLLDVLACNKVTRKGLPRKISCKNCFPRGLIMGMSQKKNFKASTEAFSLF
jgi:hypothetical protein